MARFDPTISTLTAAGILAVATSLTLNWAATDLGRQSAGLAAASAQAADSQPSRQQWAASATGRIEPRNGEIRITAQAPGQIVEVPVKINERVSEGDLLVRLDDDDLLSKLTAAEAEAKVRVRERDEEPAAPKSLQQERQVAEDVAYASGQAVFRARLAVDEAMRYAKSGGGRPDDVAVARDKLAQAEKKLTDDRSALAIVSAKDGMPLPTRLESSLTTARSDVAQIENAIEKTRIRAPTDGTLLSVWAKVGELATPSPDAPLVLFGDLSSLRVRAEVEERDVVRVRVGQRAVIRVDAFPDHDFTGVVTDLAPALGAPRITNRGPRRPNDVEVLEVLISLDGQPPLLTGMRVDVFFKNENAAAADAASPGGPVATSSIGKDDR